MCTVCETDEWMGRLEAAKYLHVHPETLRRIVKRGELPRYRQGRETVFRKHDLDKYKTPKLL
jgi:excisionase family DNA binding protein